MPIRVAVLDLDDYAGGLTPVEQGGGQQTTSLRLLGADGREYTFRSVNKSPARARQPDFAGALAGKLLQDQVSSLLPAAPVPASRLALAVGLLHPRPDLFVMPDDPALGEFRETFAGMLGTLEERADELEDGGAGFGGFTRIAGTDSFLDNLEDDSRNRVDSRGYLTARLTDLILGDWDRHEDQWRWARTPDGEGYLWIPIPRDRDYAFANYDGALMNMVRRVAPNAVRFDDDFSDLQGLLLNATPLDRQLLASIDRPTWDSVTVAVQNSLTDAEIDAAVAQMPPEFFAVRGAEIATRLKVRRDGLAAASAKFYDHIARVPEVWATDDDETAYITRLQNGDIALRIDSEGTAPYFSRRFHPDETSEIRVFLRGGDDRAFVRGNAERGIRLRVIGGGGEDLLADSSSVSRLGRWTVFYDDDDDTEFLATGATAINRRDRPDSDPLIEFELIPIPPPDYGSDLLFRPIVDYSTTRGLVLGAGAQMTRYAFRRNPWASRTWINGRFSTRWKDVGVEVGARLSGNDPKFGVDAYLEGSRIDALRFYGFGNETTRELPSELYVVRRELLEANVNLAYQVAPYLRASAGPIGRYARPRVIPGSPLAEQAPLGIDGFSAFGLRGRIEMARGDTISELNLRGNLTTDGFPITSESSEYFVDSRAHASIRIPIAHDGFTSIGGRLGGQYVWGDYPFYNAAYLGGRETLRGYPDARFAGDGMVYGGTELSAYLGRVPFILRWQTSLFGFADAGRVFLEGEESDKWYAAPGAGVEFSAVDFTLRFSYAQGPDPRIYFETVRPF